MYFSLMKFGKDSVECGILCLEWPIDNVPGNPNDLISLINKMEKQQSKHEGSPVVVMCRYSCDVNIKMLTIITTQTSPKAKT